MRMAASIYLDLRREIIALERLPGAPLNEQEIAQKRGVSRTPVREAILRLSDDGLAEIFPQSGTFVSKIPLADLPEAVFVRHTLEAAIVRELVACQTPEHASALVTCLDEQRDAAQGGDLERFHHHDDAFHAMMASCAGHAKTWGVIDQSKINLDRFRRLTLLDSGQMLRVIDEHVGIFDAILARDADRSEALLVKHLRDVLRMVKTLRELHKDLFAQ